MSAPWRVRYAPNKGSARPTRVRVTIGSEHRDLFPTEARQIADRLHDMCDRIEQDQRTTTQEDTC